MEDRSFWYLTQDNIIENIDIDERLTASFKRVMNRLQEYFNANGYTKDRDYHDFFRQYLLGDGENKLKIMVSSEPSKIGAYGFYRHYREICEIHIDEEMLKKDYLEIDAVLCHEFIHFLVMRALDKVKYADAEIKKGGFINEAITEMLTQQLYPNSKSYEPQVSMLKFANTLTGNVNNYSLFLRGKVDSKGGASSWVNFTSSASKYQKEWEDKGFVMRFAITDPNYIDAQRKIIEANIKPHLISSFEEYEKWNSILDGRPAPDTEWIDNFKHNMDLGFIGNLSLYDPNMKTFLENKLKEYRSLMTRLNEYDKKDVIEFEIAGKRVAIDESRKIYKTDILQYQATWNPGTRIYEFKVDNEIVRIDMATANFKARKEELKQKINDIKSMFSMIVSQDLKALSSGINPDGLQRIERVKLPNINQSKIPILIYVAIYKDHIEVLDNPIKLGTMHNVSHYEYLGLTSKTNGLIYQRPIDAIKEGVVFSTLKMNSIDKSITSYYYNQLKNSVKEEELLEIIQSYRASDEYDSDDERNTITIKNAAISWYTRTLLTNMSDEDKKELYVQVIDNNPRYIISFKDGKLDISLLFGSDPDIAYKGIREVLVDMNNNALFNDYFNGIPKEKGNKENTSILLDESGNIDIEGKNRNKSIISQVERLLNIHITSTDSYIYDSNLKVPRIMLKDASTLNGELVYILDELERLYYDGTININAYLSMKKAVSEEYEEMVSASESIDQVIEGSAIKK